MYRLATKRNAKKGKHQKAQKQKAKQQNSGAYETMLLTVKAFL